MANPAELLHRLFVSWSEPEHLSTTSVRGDDSLNEHVRAVGYLNSIDEALTSLELQGKKVSVWRRQFPTWKKIVFNYPRSWGSSNEGSVDKIAVDHLETLIDRVDEVAPKIEVDKIAVLLLYLSAVEMALQDDKTLPVSARRHVTAAVKQIRDYVDNLDLVDAFDFEKAINKLFTALAHAVFLSKDRDRWSGWVENFMWMGFGDFYGRATDSVSELVESSGGVLSLIAGS